MTAYSREASDDHMPSSAPDVRCHRAVASAVCGYRIDVVTFSVEDLVRSAGGWLFDRASEGWTVSVAMTEPADIRPLQILGLRTVSVSDAGSNADLAHALAATADVFGSDARVRGQVVTAFSRRDTERTLWSDATPQKLNQPVKTVQHRLSTAARMFKAQALLAASLPHQSVGPTETLYSCAESRLLDG